MGVVRNVNLGLDVYARGEDNGLWHRWHEPGGPDGWSQWEPLGGDLQGGPAVVIHAGVTARDGRRIT